MISCFHECLENKQSTDDIKKLLSGRGKLFIEMIQKQSNNSTADNMGKFKVDNAMSPELTSVTIDFSIKIVKS